MRESPSVTLMEKIQKQGGRIDYSDPYVPMFPKMREHNFDLKSVPLTPETLENYDCVILSTDHDSFDYNMILKHSKMLVDTRGKIRERIDKVIQA